MPRGDKKKVQHCEQHQFRLTPIRLDTFLKQSATLSYCKGSVQPKTRKQHTKLENNQNCGCFPIFNKDKNYATGSFILPEEMKHFVENSEKLKFQHEQRVYQYNEEKSKIYIPKPKSKYSYCSTCKSNYDDYLEHIQSQTHKCSIRKSRISLYIKDLQKNYQGSNRRKNITGSLKNFDGGSTSNYNDICIDELSRPQKRVKMETSIKTVPQTNLDNLPMRPYQNTCEPSFPFDLYYRCFGFPQFQFLNGGMNPMGPMSSMNPIGSMGANIGLMNMNLGYCGDFQNYYPTFPHQNILYMNSMNNMPCSYLAIGPAQEKPMIINLDSVDHKQN